MDFPLYRQVKWEGKEKHELLSEEEVKMLVLDRFVDKLYLPPALTALQEASIDTPATADMIYLFTSPLDRFLLLLRMVLSSDPENLGLIDVGWLGVLSGRPRCYQRDRYPSGRTGRAWNPATS